MDDAAFDGELIEGKLEDFGELSTFMSLFMPVLMTVALLGVMGEKSLVCLYFMNYYLVFSSCCFASSPFIILYLERGIFKLE